MLNLKISLVTSTGILLASKPEEMDDTKQILATGLMTALISFSKEVHQRELQSISYQDRTVSFVKIYDFVLIIETIDEEAEFSEQRLEQLLEQLKTCISPILEGFDPNTISEGEAALILVRCLQDIQSLQYSITEQPFKLVESAFFTLLHSAKGFEIKNQTGSGSYILAIASILDSLRVNEKFQNALRSILIHLPEEKCTAYIVIESYDKKSNIGVLKIPPELDFVIFRLFTLMNRRLQVISQKEEKKTMETILKELKNINDPGNRLSNINLEDISPTFLDRTVGRNLDKVIYSAIVANPIFIIGDKPTVKLVIDTLSIFYQHLQTSINLWMTDNNLKQESSCEFSEKICGMSFEIYKNLLETGEISETDTSVNLVNGKVTGIKSSNYFRKLFDTLKTLNITELVTKISLELEKLVRLSLNLTSLALYNKEKTKQKMKELYTKTGYSSSFFNKALELAIKRNSLLDYLAKI